MKRCVLHWIHPPPSVSDRQDFLAFRRGSVYTLICYCYGFLKYGLIDNRWLAGFLPPTIFCYKARTNSLFAMKKHLPLQIFRQNMEMVRSEWMRGLVALSTLQFSIIMTGQPAPPQRTPLRNQVLIRPLAVKLVGAHNSTYRVYNCRWPFVSAIYMGPIAPFITRLRQSCRYSSFSGSCEAPDFEAKSRRLWV